MTGGRGSPLRPRAKTVFVRDGYDAAKWFVVGADDSGTGPVAGITRFSAAVTPARMQAMGRALTADDILPLVASLTPRERVRLLRLIALPQGTDASVYRSVPPSRDEFSAEDEPLAWDAEGWEDLG